MSASDLVIVLSCCSTKLPHPAPARDLYQSAFFRNLKAFCEKTGAPWYINSAKYGLLHPDDVIEPYNLCLWHNNNMRAMAKKTGKTLPPLQAPEVYRKNQQAASTILGSWDKRLYLMSHHYIAGLPSGITPFANDFWIKQCRKARELREGVLTLDHLLTP